MVRWAYFLYHQELIQVYTECGGKIGTFDPDEPDDLLHARRAIFEYLMPGRVRVWYASCGGDNGMIFFVGKPVRDIRKAISRDLARRCWDMFERPPNPCTVVENSLNRKWDLIKYDRSTSRLELVEFMQYVMFDISYELGTNKYARLRSDRKGDMYPEEILPSPSKDN